MLFLKSGLADLRDAAQYDNYQTLSIIVDIQVKFYFYR